MRNIFPIFTNNLALCGTVWTTLACRIAPCIQENTTQSFAFSFTSRNLRFLQTNFTHSHSIAFLPVAVFYQQTAFPKVCCLMLLLNIILASIANSSANPSPPFCRKKSNCSTTNSCCISIFFPFSLQIYSYTETHNVLNLNSSQTHSTFPNKQTLIFLIKNMFVSLECLRSAVCAFN